jgi:hypothetical protein
VVSVAVLPIEPAHPTGNVFNFWFLHAIASLVLLLWSELGRFGLLSQNALICYAFLIITTLKDS